VERALLPAAFDFDFELDLISILTLILNSTMTVALTLTPKRIGKGTASAVPQSAH
jgi:hypothetical protein